MYIRTHLHSTHIYMYIHTIANTASSLLCVCFIIGVHSVIGNCKKELLLGYRDGPSHLVCSYYAPTLQASGLGEWQTHW